MTLAELNAERDRLHAQLAELGADNNSPAGVRTKHNRIVAGIKKIDEQIKTAREARVLAGVATADADNAVYNTGRRAAPRGRFDRPVIEAGGFQPLTAEMAAPTDARNRALGLLERMVDAGVATSAQADRLAAPLDRDGTGVFAMSLLANANPDYKAGFAKMAAGAPELLTEAERGALAVSRQAGFMAGGFMAAGTIGSGPGGGYAVPVELDPTVLATSDGAVNPLRSISRVVSITGKEWEGVSSDGVVATRRSEAAETDDNAPTLAQPTVTPTRVDVFVPFSVELGSSWTGIAGEIAKMIQDAKDAEEATSFISGDGTAPNPEGLLTGATITVSPSTATLQVDDLYDVVEALPPRFAGNARWIYSLPTAGLIRRLVPNGSTTERQVLNDDESLLLRLPASIVSSMPAVGSGNEPIVLGDFSRFLIVDQIGMRVELIPHLFGANRRPTGQRGFVAVWTSGCKVLTAEAFRPLAFA